MKFCIGSAQIGSNYGLLNNKVDKKNLSKILKFSKKNKINYIDTAISYRNSHKILSSYNIKNFKLITKFKLPKTIKKHEVRNYVYNEAIKSKKYLKINQIYGFLIHNILDLINFPNEINLAFQDLKNDKIIIKNGISIYSESEIDKIIEYFSPDIIQVPVNILNQQFLKSKKLKNLKKKNKILIFVRSIFLQGVLLMEKNYILANKNISLRLKRKLIEWNFWCDKKKITKLEACLNLIKNQNILDVLIVGFDSLIQFKETIRHFNKKKYPLNLNKFDLKNKKLADPRLW